MLRFEVDGLEVVLDAKNAKERRSRRIDLAEFG